MADQQLTSVRFDVETLHVLKDLAVVNGTSVAAEIREAVESHIREVASRPDFVHRVDARRQQMEAEATEFAAKIRQLAVDGSRVSKESEGRGTAEL
ncbi:hypothetical protein [Serinicoccus chungangensis]|uniref:hypothetical protein n=1 Tax=Serinicoccus chungangensis TaxID=767452 RepID=UPI001119C897|nr:hypothetical protein [Serinicoccus chungangensis]